LSKRHGDAVSRVTDASMSFGHDKRKLMIVFAGFSFMLNLLHRTLVIGLLAFGFTLSAAWAALLGYGLFRVATIVFE
jgi:hypothetical protein